MSKKLAAKNALIEMPAVTPSAPAEASVATAARPRTAVGGMAQFVTTQSPLHREAEELRKIVATFEGARVVKALSPATVIPSAWANRHNASFDSSEFSELKREIREAGGNVQPIKVRPLNGSTVPIESAPRYEIVFGHRRHRACLDLNLPVNALIEEVDDQRLFEQMERENRGRKNLSAWEQGNMYLNALDRGLYPSQRRLSEAIGVDVALVSKSIALAKLPKEIISAFASPLDVQFRWAQILTEAHRRDAAGMTKRARGIMSEQSEKPMTASHVLARLTATFDPPKPHAENRKPLMIGKKRVGEWAVGTDGAVRLRLIAGALSPEGREQLLVSVESILNRS